MISIALRTDDIARLTCMTIFTSSVLFSFPVRPVDEGKI